MVQLLLAAAFVATLLGVFVGQRSAARSFAKGSGKIKFALKLVVAIALGFAVDHFAPDVFAGPLQMAQNLGAVSANAWIFSGFTTISLLFAFTTGWCMSYFAAMVNAALAARKAAE